MAKVSPAFNSFAGGELSPLLEGRQDIDKYPIGCRRLRNFLPLIYGPARKRGGTAYASEAKDSSDRTWLRRFVFSETDAVIIEFGDLYVRFYTDRGPIEDPPGTPVEVVSPYAVADLINDEGSFALSIAQSGDVLYIAHGSYAPRTLSRTSNTSWAFATYAPEDGPFAPQNIDETITVKVGAATGSAQTFTNDAAGVPLPEANSVGRLIRVEETDRSAIKPWEANKRIAAVGQNPDGELRRSDGKVYECATNDTVGGGEVEFRTGTVKPIHTSGTEGDGDGEPLYSGDTVFAGRMGVDWTYLHAGYGVARVVSVAVGGATASVDILSRFPASIVHPNTSFRWALGAWYPGSYPSAVGFFRDRLAWAGGQQVWVSVAGDYASHAPDEFGEVLPDSAFDATISVGNNDQAGWLSEQTEGLVVGTGGDLVALKEITKAQVLAPANKKFEPQKSHGARKVPPVDAGDGFLYVETGGRRIREGQYDASKEKFVAVDLTAYSEHVTRSGIIATAFTKSPNPILWCLRADGKLAALTYEREQGVLAWSLHDFGGVVESIDAIPGPDAGVDDLYLAVRRTIDGATVRYVEVLLPPHVAPNDPYLHCGFDCAITYDGEQAVALTPGAGATVAGTEGVTFTAAAGVFVVGDVGREIHLRVYDEDADEDAGELPWTTAKAVITGYTSATVVEAEIVTAFPSTAQIAAGGWRLTATTISGLDHLEGESVRVNGDGADFEDDFTVSGGEIAIPRACAIVHVGFGVRAVLQTMNLEAGANDGTAQTKNKRFPTVTFRLFETMGGEFGPNTTLLDPIEYRRPSQAMAEAMPLFTGDKSVPWNGDWETEGRITFVHDAGTPCTLLAIFPVAEVSGPKAASD
jgi:hypothetical protein